METDPFCNDLPESMFTTSRSDKHRVRLWIGIHLFGQKINRSKDWLSVQMQISIKLKRNTLFGGSNSSPSITQTCPAHFFLTVKAQAEPWCGGAALGWRQPNAPLSLRTCPDDLWKPGCERRWSRLRSIQSCEGVKDGGMKRWAFHCLFTW